MEAWRRSKTKVAGANPAKVKDFGDKDLLQHIGLARRSEDSKLPGVSISEESLALNANGGREGDCRTENMIRPRQLTYQRTQ
jgi:hypothetical protein